jgi:tetratricopeptide (TPR) repeat protein
VLRISDFLATPWERAAFMAVTDDMLTLAVNYHRQGALALAEQLYQQILNIDPDHADALQLRGALAHQQGRHAEAWHYLRHAIRVDATQAHFHNNLASTCKELGRLDEARAECYRALSLNPRYASPNNNLGNIWYALGLLDEARGSYTQAVRLDPTYGVAHNNLGRVAYAQGRLKEAEACYHRALELQPDLAGARCNLGMLHLVQGDFARGWQEYEARWQSFCVLPPMPVPPWDGSDPAGRTLLLYAEQGLGDGIQFSRYAALVQRLGARVVLAAPPELHELLATCPGVERVTSIPPAPVGPCDAYVPSLSLPRLLGTTLDTVPANIPYLFPPGERVAFWKQELSALSGFKVGICWAGNPVNPADRQRSTTLARLEPLTRVPGVCLLSLQKGPGSDQLKALAGEWKLTDLGSRLTTWTDTAALLPALDLVITVDTGVAHLAGALGVPAWVALPRGPDFRWLLDRADSPWYPSLRLFRQEKAGDWEPVFDRIAASLQEFLVK